MRIYLKKIFKLFPEHPSWRLLTSTLRMTIYQPILPICWHLLLTGIFGFFRKYSASFGNIRLLSEKSAYFGNIPLPSETFGFFRKNRLTSEIFGFLRKHSASFGKIGLLRKYSASFGNIRLLSEKFGSFRKHSVPQSFSVGREQSCILTWKISF